MQCGKNGVPTFKGKDEKIVIRTSADGVLSLSEKVLDSLIRCPGSRNNHLKGVQRDLESMTRFLQSDKGGSWKFHEITLLHNPNSFEAREAVQSAIADYSFVYFSGHGYTDPTN